MSKLTTEQKSALFDEADSIKELINEFAEKVEHVPWIFNPLVTIDLQFDKIKNDIKSAITQGESSKL